jgi:CubicO group peptidase (beta-lactamase class C family)
VEDGKLDLDKPFSDVFPYFKGSNKEGITLREFLAHQGGLQPSVGWGGIIFDENRNLRKDLFSYSQSEEYPIEVYSNMWGRKDLPEIVYQAVADTKLREKKYRYSCMSFLCYPYVIKQVTGKEYEDFLRDEFYIPLGADAIMLNPTHRYPRKKIMPTEVDETFRNSMVRGYVHDESAALLGGISGNAGVFSNAESMAKILQMLLNGGTYNGKRYLKKKTIQEWTSCQYPENDNRRGLGFDRPYFDSNPDDSYPINEVSDKSWGHTGFTGTFFFIDKETSFYFILLTNRVHFTRENRLMLRHRRKTCNCAITEYHRLKNIK